MTRTYANPVPEGYSVPQAVRDLVAGGLLTDNSWGNDVCPSFAINGQDDFLLWCDHPNLDERELHGKRFLIARYDSDNVCIEQVLATDDLDEMLACLKSQTQETVQ